jgi:hypothetical protein
VDDLLAGLEAQADAETEPERKSRLRAAAETIRSTGYKVMVDAAAKYVEHKIPGG